MREIKFRGKAKYNGNHRFSSEWVYGNLIKVKKFVTYSLRDSAAELVDEWVYAIQEERLENGLYYRYVNIEIDPSTISQYTGLKDKNGVEIYEGDFIEAYILDEDKERKEKLLCTSLDGLQDLSWLCEDGSGSYHLGFVYWEDSCKFCSPLVEFEVLGNIIDNPEGWGGK